MLEQDIKYKLQFQDDYSAKLNAAQAGSAKFASAQKSAWGSVKTYIMQAGTAMAAYFSARALVSFTTAVMNHAVQVDNMARMYDMSAESVQRWQYVSEITGASTESLTKAMKKLAMSAYDAERGSKLQIKAFEDLGMSTDEVSKKSKNLEKFYVEILERLGQMEDTTTRTAVASALLGRAGTELSAVYRLQSGVLENINRRFDDLNASMSEEQIQSARELGDAITDLKASFHQLGVEMLTPGIAKFASFLNTLTSQDFRQWVSYKLSLKNITGVDWGAIFQGEGPTEPTGIGASGASMLGKLKTGPTGPRMLGPFITPPGKKDPYEAKPFGKIDAMGRLEEEGVVGPIDEDVAAWADKIAAREEWAEKYAEQLRIEALTDRELLEERYKVEMNLLENNLEGQQRLTLRHQKARQQLRQQEKFQSQAATLDMWGSILAIGEAFGAKVFYAQKALALAGAIVDMNRGVAQALGAYPPPLSFKMAAAVKAAGFAAIAGIVASAISGPSGGATGGGSSGSPGDAGGYNAPTPQPAPEQTPAQQPQESRDITYLTIQAIKPDDGIEALEEWLARRARDGKSQLVVRK